MKDAASMNVNDGFDRLSAPFDSLVLTDAGGFVKIVLEVAVACFAKQDSPAAGGPKIPC